MFVMQYHYVEIDSGGMIYVSDTVYTKPETMIIVEPGGELQLNNGAFIGLCRWHGIQVLGDPDTLQHKSLQGYVKLSNNSSIQNSEYGIYAYKMENNIELDGWITVSGYEGGIIQVSNSSFINNQRSVQFEDYSSFNSLSSFTNCEFKNDTNYFISTYPPYFMRISGMQNIDIINCDFINETDSICVQKGIYSFDSNIDIEGLYDENTEEWDSCLFKNLQYGIYAANSTSNHYIDVRHTVFNDNWRGLYTSAIDNSRITSNSFIVDTPYEENGGCGLYLNNSTGYWVEENAFYHDPAVTDTMGVGIVVHNSGGDANEIYRNTFENLQLGITAQEQNRNTSVKNQGLQILCNDFNDCNADVLVPEPEATNRGINSYQGVSGTDPEDMAGNLFYIPGP